MVAVNNSVSQIGERFVRHDTEVEAEFKLPASVKRRKPFLEVGGDIRMDVEDEVLDLESVHEVFKFLVESVCEKERGLHFPFAVA